MKTKAFTHPLAALAGGLLLAVSAVSWASPPAASGVLQGHDGDPSILTVSRAGEPATHGVRCISNPLKRCRAKLATCREDLAACLAEPRGIFPGDGQTGVPLKYTDNGDGTFTDDNTGLMWESKDGDDGDEDYTNPHDVDNGYTWTSDIDDDSTNPDGTAFTEFLAELNEEPGFAGHTDWRLPTVKELQSLVDYSVPFPYPGPTVAAGLPGATSAAAFHWSSTSYASDGEFAWGVRFPYGFVSYDVFKGSDDLPVRAVRGGW